LSVTFIRGLENYRPQSDRPTVATIGTFDGIHRGHQAILMRVGEVSQATGHDAVLVTFDPHPRVVLSPEQIPLLLTSIEEKEKFIPDFFSGTVLVLEFNEKLKDLSAEEFVKNIMVRTIGAKEMIVGYDHALGRNRGGNIDELRRLGELYGFGVEVVGPVMNQKMPISSSRIRRAMLENDYEEAMSLLGHDYAIYGTVEKGIGLGRRIGYPTANVRYSLRKLLPPEGVYVCWAQVAGETKCGMMFIGKNYFNPQKRVSVEAHLFNFDKEIYNEEIIVYPTRFVRSNKKFDSTAALVEQIKKDEKNILEIIEKEKQSVCEEREKTKDHC